VAPQWLLVSVKWELDNVIVWFSEHPIFQSSLLDLDFCCMNQQELENRLLMFGADVVRLTKRMPRTSLSLYLIDQLTRSATAPALMYGEACASESRQDFIHKMSIGLKELRETRMSLQIVRINQLVTGSDVDNLIDENEQLIRIFGKSINTARRNRLKPANG